jgi:uncharacterized DUF497 family protein
MDKFEFEWNNDKNSLLIQERNVCFEDIVTCIENDKLLGIIKNPSENRSNQFCMIVNISDYAYVVPFVKNGNVFFLKTIYKSRKQTKKYLRGDQNE